MSLSVEREEESWSDDEPPNFCNEPGPPHTKEELQKTLCQYATDTLSHIATVRKFCQSLSKWKDDRTAEKKKMEDIKKRADRRKTFGEHVMALFNNDTIHEELVKELGVVLEDTIEGLEKLNTFVDAVEKLAVTSLHVFVEENQSLLPEGTSFHSVQAVITAAIQVCPLILQFKREARTFFSPSLHNVQEHSLYLGNYISITQEICEIMESAVSEFQNMKLTETVAQLTENLSEDAKLDMLNHIKRLTDIRKDQHFRVGFLFQDECSSGFIRKFSECEPRMLNFLNELEKTAVKLDYVKNCSQTACEMSSFVGTLGGLLVCYFLFAPVLQEYVMMAVIISGISGVVIPLLEMGYNRKYLNEAIEIFHKFIGDMMSLQGYLDEVYKKANTTLLEETNNVVLGVENAQRKADIPCCGNVIVQDIKLGYNFILHEIARLTAGTLVISKWFRRGLIGINALFIAIDFMSGHICKTGLDKGSHSEGSQFIRARASLWRSELDSWRKIHDSLSAEKEGVIDLPFIKKGWTKILVD